MGKLFFEPSQLYEKECNVIGTCKGPASEEKRDEQTINAVPPRMRIPIGRPSNSPQAIALKQQLDANTIMYETYYHKSTDKLDPRVAHN
ncbi:MAG: hypothetical protein EZS28_004013 [Streblomastix strix]|uniref:Uncharacterized protein n=1 Tax=Streblomastix strix TaxID=222440 RepID=A0A5J4WZZ6_9EUKA|nr:MAG: hypothetical protein EZS28_004013 [Streblomastix strix]